MSNCSVPQAYRSSRASAAQQIQIAAVFGLQHVVAPQAAPAALGTDTGRRAEGRAALRQFRFVWPVLNAALQGGTELEDIPIQWSEDGRDLFVYQSLGLPATVYRIDLETGEPVAMPTQGILCSSM